MPVPVNGVVLVGPHGEGAEHPHRLVLQEAGGEEGKGRMIETVTELVVNFVWPQTEVLVLVVKQSNIQQRETSIEPLYAFIGRFLDIFRDFQHDYMSPKREEGKKSIIIKVIIS